MRVSGLGREMSSSAGTGNLRSNGVLCAAAERTRENKGGQAQAETPKTRGNVSELNNKEKAECVGEE
jgi:hypothetical protein